MDSAVLFLHPFVYYCDWCHKAIKIMSTQEVCKLKALSKQKPAIKNRAVVQ